MHDLRGISRRTVGLGLGRPSERERCAKMHPVFQAGQTTLADNEIAEKTESFVINSSLVIYGNSSYSERLKKQLWAEMHT